MESRRPAFEGSDPEFDAKTQGGTRRRKKARSRKEEDQKFPFSLLFFCVSASALRLCVNSAPTPPRPLVSISGSFGEIENGSAVRSSLVARRGGPLGAGLGSPLPGGDRVIFLVGRRRTSVLGNVGHRLALTLDGHQIHELREQRDHLQELVSMRLHLSKERSGDDPGRISCVRAQQTRHRYSIPFLSRRPRARPRITCSPGATFDLSPFLHVWGAALGPHQGVDEPQARALVACPPRNVAKADRS
jgi:hypothetical protein